MPVGGFVNFEGSITMLPDVPPGMFKRIGLLDLEDRLEKVAILYCLPSDQAADLHIFEAANDAYILVEPPYNLLHETNRAVRVEQDTRVPHNVEMNDGRIARFLLAHDIDDYSLSLS